MRKKSSTIWTTSKFELEEIVKRSQTISNILKELGYKVFTSSSYQTLKRRMSQDGIDFSHIPLGIGSNKNRPQPCVALTREEAIEKWFRVLNFKYCNRSQLIFIRKFNLLPYKCELCSNNGVWQNKNLILQLDHKNGVREDNRLENLRLLCPNCHSQTGTFSNKKRN